MAWNKILLFGVFGVVGCLAGWLVGEPFLLLVEAAAPKEAGRAASLISKPVEPSTNPPPPSEEFQKRLREAGAQTGDIQISLIWNDTNDLDLHCIDPSGFEISYRNKQAPSGGHLDVDRNAACRMLTNEPVENIYWPKGRAPLGEYRVYINFYQQCIGGKDASDWKLTVLENGRRTEKSGILAKNVGALEGPKEEVFRFRIGPAIELFTPKEFQIHAGSTVKVPVSIRRLHYEGPVEVKAEKLPTGITAEKLTIPTGKNDGELILTATNDAKESTEQVVATFVATGGGLSSAPAEAHVSVLQSIDTYALWMIPAIGFWTALLAAGLCLSLIAGQNRYLGKPLFASGRVSPALIVAGAAGAGFLSGSVGQSLYYLFLSAGIAQLGLVLGWMMLGGLLGAGVSFFVPNLNLKGAALAGLAGGLLGGLFFWALSYAADTLGRFSGAALLGFSIGLMVAVVEAAFRKAWLEVRYSEREAITINLGPEPVKVGGDAKACTVWARGAPDVALRYWIREGRIYCEDLQTRSEVTVVSGDHRIVGNVQLTVCTTGSAGVPKVRLTPPPVPVLPQSPPPLPPPLPPPHSPPKPATMEKVNDPDSCPSCGRKSPGRPGARYCMVCDQTF